MQLSSLASGDELLETVVANTLEAAKAALLVVGLVQRRRRRRVTGFANAKRLVVQLRELVFELMREIHSPHPCAPAFHGDVLEAVIASAVEAAEAALLVAGSVGIQRGGDWRGSKFPGTRREKRPQVARLMGVGLW